jgi:hypothetical protein
MRLQECRSEDLATRYESLRFEDESPNFRIGNSSPSHEQAPPSAQDPPRTYDADLSQSLACVRVLCRHGPNVLRLPHILDKLNEFLD